MQDLTSPLDKLDLKGNVKGLKEWNEGYEDLEAIQFSFVVEFLRDSRYWSIFADTEEEKVSLRLLLADEFTKIFPVQTLGPFQSCWRSVRCIILVLVVLYVLSRVVYTWRTEDVTLHNRNMRDS